MTDRVMDARPTGAPAWLAPPPGFFLRPSTVLAPALLGCLLLTDREGGPTSGVIVETEAYTADDPASHSFRGPTRRNRSMFGEGGIAYVYSIYGMHVCFNVVAGPRGAGEAVLVRALRPVDGLVEMQRRRGRPGARPASGPALLCSALGITMEDDGADLAAIPGKGPAILVPAAGITGATGVSARIGVTRAAEWPRRYYLSGNPFLSRRSP